MRTESRFSTREALEASLNDDFSADVIWPIAYAAMAALVDMGLSDGKIARYFRVLPGDVAALRDRYDLRANGPRS